MAKKPDFGTVAADDGRYHVEGFHFVGQSLSHAVKLFRPEVSSGPARHLTAHELIQGAVDLAANRYGLLGDLTFALIEHGVFTKQPEDRLEDFTGHAALTDALRDCVRQRLGLNN
jgi:hypothetical protein